MRLLETTDGRTYRLTDDFLHEDQLPAYAILSHTWEDGQEVIFNDLIEDGKSKYRRLRKSLRLRPRSGKKGYNKLAFCARQAKRDGLCYFWVDTCCIFKEDDTELKRSINSMFQWYRNAAKCYVYLSDVSTEGSNKDSGTLPWQLAFANSRWFTRGWTLQELLAPTVLEFFSREGVCLGSRLELQQQIHEITDIPTQALSGAPLDEFSVDERLSWAAERQTTREEDEVYALLGIFGVNLPFVYDEGYDRTLRRLLDKIDELRAAAVEKGSQVTRLLQTTMPFQRDGDFVSRDTLDVVQGFCTRPAGCAALVGLGGVGKSQIAIECCYRILDESPTTRVFWVHAETRARLKEGYLEIARKNSIDGWDDPETDIMQLVHAWLLNEANGRWLLVLDSADDPDVFSSASSAHDVVATADSATTESPLPAFLPCTPTGSVLVTSRSHHVASMLTGTKSSVVEVGPMNSQDAFALLQKKFTYAVKKDEADALITALDHMPLALTQAAAFINRTPRMSISRYLTEVDYDRASTSSKYLVDNRRDPNASNSIMTTWQISFNYIRERSPAAARLLSLMSMFDRQGIPKSLLVDKYAEAGQASPDFDHDMYMLTSFCLVKATVNEDSFEMHGLVQVSTKKWLQQHENLEHWKEIYVKILNESFPDEGTDNRTLCRTLFPHAQAALNDHPFEADALEEWASISSKAASYLGQMGEHARAYKLALDALEVREILLHPDDVEVFESLISVGVALKRLGRYDEAKAMYQRAAENRERVFGPFHVHTLFNKLNIASLYDAQGHWTEAESLLEQIFDIASKQDTEVGRSLTLFILSALAHMHTNYGRYEKAAALQLQVLEARERELGVDHPTTVLAKSHLADTYRLQGRSKESEKLNLEVLRFYEQNGYAFTEVLSSKADLAVNYADQGRWDEAETLQKEVLSETLAKMGPDHPHTLYSMANMASMQKIQGRLSEAEALLLQLLDKRKSLWGDEHPTTLTIKSTLAETYCDLKRYAEAEALALDVLGHREAKLEDEHPAILDAKALLALVYCDQGRYREAQQLNELVLGLRKKVLGEEHDRTLGSMGNLAVTYHRQGFVKEAFELMEECYQGHIRVLGEQHPITGRYKAGLEKWRRGESGSG